MAQHSNFIYLFIYLFSSVNLPCSETAESEMGCLNGGTCYVRKVSCHCRTEGQVKWRGDRCEIRDGASPKGQMVHFGKWPAGNVHMAWSDTTLLWIEICDNKLIINKDASYRRIDVTCFISFFLPLSLFCSQNCFFFLFVLFYSFFFIILFFILIK